MKPQSLARRTGRRPPPRRDAITEESMELATGRLPVRGKKKEGR